MLAALTGYQAGERACMGVCIRTSIACHSHPFGIGDGPSNHKPYHSCIIFIDDGEENRWRSDSSARRASPQRSPVEH
jgi:hypothetical protein